ncbi:PREDICTED: lysine-rich arabinogalactan protein 19-like isoform X2 [Branchiostoma belcheri]|uniref:Lysine-rich arabinogalactan protein 19-like isoform X2 n=1 Tax=Branchiostoma belcheri TaxID=7741 RepID=A0A6P5A8C2_BRABE|nr:PREDICTED: lysine-rich arabinogalactan protein 19-like isoform X2 [Branchiostoma belcheri]
MGKGEGGGGRRGRARRHGRRAHHRGGGGDGAAMFRAPATGNPALDRRINMARLMSFLAFVVILSGVYVFTSWSMIWGIIMITGAGLVFVSLAFSIVHMRKTAAVNTQPQGTRTGGLQTVTTTPPTIGYPPSPSSAAPVSTQYGFTAGLTYGARYSSDGPGPTGIVPLPGYPGLPPPVPQPYPGIPSGVPPQDYVMPQPPQYPQVPLTHPAYPPPPSYEDVMNPKN